MSVYLLAEANAYADGCGQDSDKVMPDLHCFKELRHVLSEVDGSPKFPARTDCRQRRVYESSKMVEDLILEDRHVLCALRWPKNANVARGGA